MVTAIDWILLRQIGWKLFQVVIASSTLFLLKTANWCLYRGLQIQLNYYKNEAILSTGVSYYGNVKNFPELSPEDICLCAFPRYHIFIIKKDARDAVETMNRQSYHTKDFILPIFLR